jgi:hypothetical protein
MITKYPGVNSYLELDPHEDYINVSITRKEVRGEAHNDVFCGEVELDNEQVIKLYTQLKKWLLKKCSDYKL